MRFNSVRKFLSDFLNPHYIRNRSQWNAMWQDNQPHGYSKPILFPHLDKTRAWLQAKYTMFALKCSTDHTVRQITL